MTTPRRRTGGPVESVTLKIKFEGGRRELSKIREAVPSAVLRKGACEVTIQAEKPADVAERAREILGWLRGA